MREGRGGLYCRERKGSARGVRGEMVPGVFTVRLFQRLQCRGCCAGSGTGSER